MGSIILVARLQVQARSGVLLPFPETGDAGRGRAGGRGQTSVG